MTLTNDGSAWHSALAWVDAEHQAYEDPKWSQEDDVKKSAEYWRDRIEMYLQRAVILGLDNPLGRQAVGKAATTAVAYLETMFVVHDTVPSPGVSSGEMKGEFRHNG